MLLPTVSHNGESIQQRDLHLLGHSLSGCGLTFIPLQGFAILIIILWLQSLQLSIWFFHAGDCCAFMFPLFLRLGREMMMSPTRSAVRHDRASTPTTGSARQCSGTVSLAGVLVSTVRRQSVLRRKIQSATNAERRLVSDLAQFVVAPRLLPMRSASRSAALRLPLLLFLPLRQIFLVAVGQTLPQSAY